ncbi:ATP12 chaperone protein [Aphelenchoides besseyi]|nr:ATP12 chaperone protein [Aphelenchoides besseyi]
MIGPRLLTTFIGRSISIQRHCSTAFLKPKRFYKQVTISTVGDDEYEVLLDQRKLKTPKGKPMIIDSEPLALAIAQEWDSQKETINVPQMRLSGLMFTAIDNPTNETRSGLADQIMEYLDNDTILYMADSPVELCQLQKKNWLPIVEWANQKHGLGLSPSHKLIEAPEIPEESRRKLHQYFAGMKFPALIGVHYGVDSIKSVLLMIACLQFHLSVERASELANLDQDYQTKVYGKVEEHHGLQEYEALNRLSAAILFAQLTSNKETRKEIPQAARA